MPYLKKNVDEIYLQNKNKLFAFILNIILVKINLLR